MKYYPTVYRTLADLDAAQHGALMVMDVDGYLVRATIRVTVKRST